MKNLTIILLIIFISLGCQEEEKIIIQNNPDNLTNNSLAVKLLKRVTQNSTNIDNVLDNSGCFSLMLPIELTINNNTISINDINDYQLVQNEKNNYLDDDDEITFNFPLTILFQNYSTQTINNQDEFDTIFNNCTDHVIESELSCIQFSFPIRIDTYDESNQKLNTELILTKKNLFTFLNQLTDEILLEIEFPISLVDADNQNIVFTEVNTLVNFLNNLTNCVENVINETLNLNEVLIQNTWIISTLILENENQTSELEAFQITFQENGTLVVTENNNTSFGSWIVFNENGGKKLEFDFENQNLEQLNDDWDLLEFSLNQIHLFDQNDNETDLLYFTKQ